MDIVVPSNSVMKFIPCPLAMESLPPALMFVFFNYLQVLEEIQEPVNFKDLSTLRRLTVWWDYIVSGEHLSG